MANKAHIRKSVYNQGRQDIDYIRLGRELLGELNLNKSNLESAIRLLKATDNTWLIDHSRPGPGSCEVKFYLSPNEYQNAWEPRKPGCQLSVDHIFDKLIWTHSDHDHLHRFWDLGHYAVSKHVSRPDDRIGVINEELRSLRQELKKNFNKSTLQQIRDLVQELHSIISFYCKKQYKHVNRLRVSFCGSLIRDIRNFIRQTVHIIFKNLPDFSGCDEEARFNSIVNLKPLFSLNNPKIYVRHKVLT